MSSYARANIKLLSRGRGKSDPTFQFKIFHIFQNLCAKFQTITMDTLKVSLALSAKDIKIFNPESDEITGTITLAGLSMSQVR